jgi:hypothetical protein
MKVQEFYNLFLANPFLGFAVLRSKNAFSISKSCYYARDDSLVESCSIPTLLDYIPPTGDTLLCNFIRKGDAATVKVLIYLGTSLIITDVMGNTPLELAIISRNYEILNDFVKEGKIPIGRELFVYNKRCIIHLACMYNDRQTLRILMDRYIGTSLFPNLLEKWAKYATGTMSFYALEYIAEKKHLIERGDDTITNALEDIHNLLCRTKKQQSYNPKTRRMQDNAAECIKILVQTVGPDLLNRNLFFEHEKNRPALMWILEQTYFLPEFKRFIIRAYMKCPRKDLITKTIEFRKLAVCMLENDTYEEFEKLIAIVSGFLKAEGNFTTFVGDRFNLRFFLGVLSAYVKKDFHYLRMVLIANISGNLGYSMTRHVGTEMLDTQELIIRFHKEVTLFDILYLDLKFREHIHNTECC